MTRYYRPICQGGTNCPKEAHVLAGGWTWFTHVEVLERNTTPQVISASEVPDDKLRRLTAPRAPICGIEMARPSVMGILNITPDSFSDGGQFDSVDSVVARASAMVKQGADILDIGGESTRPGADTVSIEDEISRVVPVISAIRGAMSAPISIDTRKSAVAEAALAAGAGLVNDVSAFGYDKAMAGYVAATDAPVCLMHAQGSPETMQNDPTYQNVVLDVYDALSDRVAKAEAAGISRDRILVDPGIGFGKTLDHNLALLRNISLFHGLGCAILLGVSRKKFIGTLSGAEVASERVAGTIGVTLGAVMQGVQMHRVHDTKEVNEAMSLWAAAYL